MDCAVLDQFGGTHVHIPAPPTSDRDHGIALDCHDASASAYRHAATARGCLRGDGRRERLGTDQRAGVDHHVAGLRRYAYRPAQSVAVGQRLASSPQAQVALRLQHQTPALVDQALRLDHTRVAQGSGKHADRTAAESAKVDDLVVLALDRERDVVQVAASDLHHLAGRQHDIATNAGDHGIAVDADIGCHQINIAVAGADAALGLNVARSGLA